MGLSRRSVLKGALLGGASAITFDKLFGYSRLAAQSAGDDVQSILNIAYTSETFACTHYYTVLTDSSIPLTPVERETLQGFLDAELQHLEFLEENGAQALATEFYAPVGVFNDRVQFGDVTEFIETTFIAAYLAATRRLAELGLPLLAATTAQIVGIEQEHLALVRQIGGRRANNVAFSRPLFFDISESNFALQPFLEGGENYDGPRRFPGADAIRDLIRDVGVLPVPTFNEPATFASPEALAGSTSCTVAPAGSINSNLRAGPGLNFAIIGRLAAGETLVVNGQTLDNDGFVWYRAANLTQWVRSDVVLLLDVCGDLPLVTI